MVSRGDETVVIYPLYFDKNLTRKQGRRVSKKMAVEKPQLENIIKSARSLGLNPHVEKDASHSSRPSVRDGRIVIDKKTSKTKLLEQIAQRI